MEYKTVTLPIDQNWQQEVQKLIDDKWDIVPGTQPCSIHHLVRAKQQVPVAGVGGLGTMKIDESKISIIRGGKVVG